MLSFFFLRAKSWEGSYIGQQERYHLWVLALANRLRVTVVLRHVLVG